MFFENLFIKNFLVFKFIFLLLIFFLLIFFFKNCDFVYKKKLYDNDFKKVQSFHHKPILKVGGIILISYLFFSYLLFYSNSLIKNLFISSIPIFFFSLIEDFKISIKPSIRLIILFLIIFFIIIFFEIRIYSVQFYNFDKILNNNLIFSVFFISFCFLFIINGSNFIDGFNGLLTIHAFIINFFLILINIEFYSEELLAVCILFQFYLIIFIFYNFPIATFFLGNSGSYLIGFILSFLVIETAQNTYYHKIYPFYFAILLHYIFFEVFFSFCRKLFYEKVSPLYPDKMHLHMLIYYKIKSNPKTSLLINLYFISTLIPLFYIKNYPGILKVYFLFLIFLYCVFYISIKKKF